MADSRTPEYSHDDFKVIFNVATVGIVQVHTKDGRFIKANDKYCQITGYTEEELKTMHFPEMTHPDDRQKDWELFSKGVHGESPGYINEKRYVRKDGSIIWVRLNAGYIRDSDGIPIKTVAVCEDISERKFREANLALLAEISKNSAFFSLESEIVKSIGKRLGTYLNISGLFLAENNEVQGTSTIDYYWSDGSLPNVTGVHKNMSFVSNEYNGTVWTGETVVVRNTQANSHINAKGFAGFNIFAYITVPYYKQNKLKYLFTVTNSTPRNWIDYEIEIIREVAYRMFLHIERARTEALLRISEERFRILSQQLQETDRRKDEFVGALSHEIRNPLASITLGLSLLDRTGLDTKKAKQAREIMGRQVSQLSRLVDDLLDVTRIARNLIVLQKEQVELNTLVQGVKADYMQMFQDKGVSLIMECSPANLYVEADPARLSQVLVNLLHNSVKFTQKGGSARVILSCDKEKQQAVIKVEDDGIGMTPETIESLFQPFVQADASLDRSNGGLGMGLALVKGLMELHDGQVEAYSEGLGKGSRFVLYIPLLREPLKLKKEDREPTRRTDKKRVLLIEDIQDVAEVLRSLLMEEGHEVRVASDGTRGVEMAKECKPDVILCDIGLPGMDGYQVAKILRSDEALKKTLLVSLTGYARSEDIRRSKEAGFQLQLTKPVELGELRKVIGHEAVCID